MKNEHIFIQHALNEGEFKISNTNYRADSYNLVEIWEYDFKNL